MAFGPITDLHKNPTLNTGTIRDYACRDVSKLAEAQPTAPAPQDRVELSEQARESGNEGGWLVDLQWLTDGIVNGSSTLKDDAAFSATQAYARARASRR